MKHHIVEQGNVVIGLVPATDAAGRNGAYISMKGYQKVFCVYNIDQGNAATIACTPQQAQDVSGTGVKALTSCRIWVNDDAAASDALVRQADAASYTTTANVKRKVVILEVEDAMLDVNNGFDCLRANTGASNVANLTSLLYVLTGARYPQVSPLTAVAN